MFAGKSSYMRNEIERRRLARKKCIILKHSADVRFGQERERVMLITHAGYEYSNVNIIQSDSIGTVSAELMKYDVIGIDEVQFFPDCVETIQALANLGKIVVCAGLDGNYMGKNFGRVHELIPLAEEVIKLKAVCMKSAECEEDASFTARIEQNDDREIDIGGLDKYVAACRKCMWGKSNAE